MISKVGNAWRRKSFSCAGVLFGLLFLGNAHAQVTVLGYWLPIFHEDVDERLPGPHAGDYAGLPVNDAARLRADTWDSGLLTVPEHQCKPHPSTYGFRGIGTTRIWETRDPETQQLVKIETYIEWEAQHRTIWMDGRPHPPASAPHTWQGFSTGRLEGDTLIVRTTHLKAGWMRRNGLALSDLTTMTDEFHRHGDILTHIYMIEDPVYLTEPLVRTNGFKIAENGTMGPYPCRPAVEIPRPRGAVPHVALDTSTYSQEYAKEFNLPVEAARGGAETALPEYTKKLQPAGQR